MENQQYHYTNYKTPSKNGSQLIGSIKAEDLLVFGVDEVKSLTGWNKNRIHNTLSNLNKKGHIIRLKKNTYTLEKHFFENTFKVITESIKPSYISFWTALSSYGFTEQQVNVIQLISTKQFHDLEIRNVNVEISTFKPEKFFGYDEIQGAVIADKEKSLVDSLFMLQKCGGLDEYTKCLRNAYPELNKDRLLKYIVRFGNRSLISRMGFLLDTLDLADEELLNDIHEHGSKGYVLLDPDGNTIRSYNNRWKIKINRDLEEIL